MTEREPETGELFAELMYDEPTTSRDSAPGSATKVLILEKRYSAGLPLWDDRDFVIPSYHTPGNSNSSMLARLQLPSGYNLGGSTVDL